MFHVGNGKLKPRLRAALEAEGIVIIQEGLDGSIRYDHFKAPGRRHNGKVTRERIGLAITEERLAVYCRSGSTKLIDQAFSNPRMSVLAASLKGSDTISINIDFDRAGLKNVSGQMTIRAQTPEAATVVEQLESRLPR